VAELLGFLAAYPGRAFSVSELSRALGQNRATCQALLLALGEADFVRRDASKAWSLGPGLIAIGDAALGGLPLIDELRAGVAALHDQLGFEILATVETGRQALVVARAGPDAAFAPAMRIGQTFPLVPPFGLAFVAWSGEAAFERWLERSTRPLSRRDVARYRKAAELARRLGYCTTLDPATRRHLAGVMAELAREPRRIEARARRDRLVQALAHDEYLVAEPGARRAPSVSLIAAPVFGPDGGVAAVISLVAFPQQISADNAAQLADALRLGAARMSARLGGGARARSRASL
jgi:DNA-binding IclR family transcriptional regulator